jgi:hypothetical protein
VDLERYLPGARRSVLSVSEVRLPEARKVKALELRDITTPHRVE